MLFYLQVFLRKKKKSLKGTTKNNSSQKGGSLSFLRPLVTNAFPLMKNILISLAKSVLIPLGLTAAAPATDRERKFLD